MIAISAGVVLVVLILVGEVAAVVLAGEGDAGAVVRTVEDAGVRAEGVHVACTGVIVGPTSVIIGHDREDKSVFLYHVGIEVDMTGSTVIPIGR